MQPKLYEVPYQPVTAKKARLRGKVEDKVMDIHVVPVNHWVFCAGCPRGYDVLGPGKHYTLHKTDPRDKAKPFCVVCKPILEMHEGAK